MRHRTTARRPRTTLVATLLALGFSGVAQAAPVPRSEVLLPPEAAAALPEDLENPGATPVNLPWTLLGDGSELAWATIEPVSAGPAGTTTWRLDPFHLAQAKPTDLTDVWDEVIPGVDGSTVITSQPAYAVDESPSLAFFDDRFRATRSVEIEGAFLDGMTVGRGGLRVFAENSRAGAREVEAIDARGRTLKRFTDLRGVQKVFTLDDGTITVVGYGEKDRLIRVRMTAGGHVLSERRATQAVWSTTDAHTGLGVVESAPAPGADLLGMGASNDRVLTLLSAGGKPRTSRTEAELHVPMPAGCAKFYGLAVTGSSPSGLPIASAQCMSDTGPTYTITGSVTFELGRDLRFKQFLDADDPGARVLGPLPDGRLAMRSTAGVVAVEVPGTPAVRRGSAGVPHRLSTHRAKVRITCRRPYGTVCSGVAKVTVHGKTVGAAPYAVPGRPGPAAGTVDRRITTTAALPAHPTVKLTRWEAGT